MPQKLSKRQTAGISRELKGLKASIDKFETKVNELDKLLISRNPNYSLSRGAQMIEGMIKKKGIKAVREDFRQFLERNEITKKMKDMDIIERIAYTNAYKHHIAEGAPKHVDNTANATGLTVRRYDARTKRDVKIMRWEPKRKIKFEH